MQRHSSPLCHKPLSNVGLSVFQNFSGSAQQRGRCPGAFAGGRSSQRGLVWGYSKCGGTSKYSSLQQIRLYPQDTMVFNKAKKHRKYIFYQLIITKYFETHPKKCLCVCVWVVPIWRANFREGSISDILFHFLFPKTSSSDEMLVLFIILINDSWTQSLPRVSFKTLILFRHLCFSLQSF